MSKTVTLLTTLLTGSALFAQKDTVTTKTLDEIVVTANKQEQKQSSTGKVITVITKDQIDKSSGKTVSQLLNDQAGITINGSLNNPGSVQTIFMRGAAAGRTLVLLDGIPVNDPSQINNDFDLNLLSINDVERIEICKGAQSTLYGSDAIGGVINIITTKKDIANAFNLKAGISGGSLGTYKANLQVYGKAGRFTYTTRYAKIKTDGFSAAYDSTGKMNYDKDGYDGNTANASVLFDAGNGLQLKGFTQYSQYKADVDAGAFTDKLNYSIHNRNFTTGTGFIVKKKSFTITGNYQYSKMHRNYNDNASIPGATAYSMNDYDAITHFAEVYTSITLGGGFRLLSGADYRYGSMNNQYRSLSVYGPYNSQFRDTSMNQRSVYSSLMFTSNFFSVELGGRMNHHSRYGDNTTFTFNPSIRMHDHYRLFGSIASAYKAPSLYELYSSSGNLNLQPEKATNYETGIQSIYRNISNRLVFFYRNTHNGIDYNSINYQYFNYVNQQTRGIEYEARMQPITRLTITGNYTFIASQETTENRVNFKDTTYGYSLRRPKHSMNIITSYQFDNPLFISVSGKYVSSRYDVGPYKKPDLLLSSYFLLGAYAEYKTGKHWKLYLDAQNLLNRKFFDVSGYNSIPSLFTAGISCNW